MISPAYRPSDFGDACAFCLNSGRICRGKSFTHGSLRSGIRPCLDLADRHIIRLLIFGRSSSYRQHCLFSVDSYPLSSSVTSLVALPASTMQRFKIVLIGRYRGRSSMSFLLFGVCALLCSGCNGRSIKVDNPVFAAAPPRRSLVNHTADAEEQKIAMAQKDSESDVQTIGFSKLSSGQLTGTSVVAEVNGKPIFVDDVLGGARQIIERDSNLPDDKRQLVMMSTLQKRLPKYVEDELIVQALEIKIPEDKRETIKDSLEPEFQKVVNGIKEKEGFVTDRQLDERLASEGISIDQLRDNFVRMQMVEGYVGSMTKVPDKIDREELLRYYREHLDEYTGEEEVRFAEIVIRFRDHDGREGAEKTMATVVTQLQSGKDFGDVAAAMSDTLTKEKRGEVGWIKRDSLSDKALENLLFDLPDGQLSKVQVQNDRFEVYKVIAHRDPGTTPFQEVQSDIEDRLLKQRREEARAKVRKEIREKGNVVTIFGDKFQLEPIQ